jgi:GT2 family glycosyltransferase
VSRVAVVIPTWNGLALLDGALGALAAQTLPARVIVVDNGSTDGTAEHMRTAHSGVELVALPENRGFAAAVNAGIATAFAAGFAAPADAGSAVAGSAAPADAGSAVAGSAAPADAGSAVAGSAAPDTEYVALLNNDMEPDPGWLAELVAALDADPGAGSAASKLRMLREPGVLDGAGDLVTWYGATWRRGHGEPDRGQYDSPDVVASPCAGAALYRRRALDQVGGFDERFFAYLEDADWGLRAQLAGWRCVYVPTAVALHLGGATSRRMGDLETELIARNTLALVLKSFPAPRLLAWSPLILGYQIYTLIRAVSHGSWRAVLRGWAGALHHLPGTLRARREVRAARTHDAHALDTVMTGFHRRGP